MRKKAVHNRNGVKVLVYDPEQRKQLESVYPSDSEVRKTATKSHRANGVAVVSKKKPTKKTKPQQLPPPPRDIYELDPGHYTQDGLNDKAKAIWLERSRHEADGEVSTPIWTGEILGMANGDIFTLKIHPEVQREIARLGDDAAASKMLQDRHGFEQEAADAIVRVSKKDRRDDWYCKEVVFECPSERLATVKFINLVEI
jgi:hypothetical protein